MEDAANGAFPTRFRQVGSGTPVYGASTVTLSIGAAFSIDVTSSHGLDAPIASMLVQLVLHSHELDEAAALDVMRRSHGQLSAAQVLSDRGLFDIYKAVCQLRGVRATCRGAGQVGLSATRAQSPESARAISIFCGLLGDAAGLAALAYNCSGGVFVKGAVVAQLGDAFARSPFRRRFENVGRFRDVLRAIPTFASSAWQHHLAAPELQAGVMQYRTR